MAKRLYIVTIVTVVLAIAVAVGPARAMLLDVTGHWASGIVSALEAKGIISGDDLGRFNPDAPLTRAQLAKLVVVGLGRESDAKLLAQSASRYTDVVSYHWAKGYIESLAESGVTDGYPDGRFGPADTVTRAQMAQFLVRAAGLADEARLRSREQTAYADDAQIPDWARGAVAVARDYGLMAGFVDRTFQPGQPLTRAQGAVALSRLLEYRGTLYQISGTLLRLDPATRRGVVRDAQGVERPFTMGLDAQYYRSGASTFISQVQPLDQVWISLNAAGEGQFLEARYTALTGTLESVKGTTVTFTPRGGSPQTVTVQPGALVYLNGRSTTLDQIASATDVYMAFDGVTNQVRVIDAMEAKVQGDIVSVDAASGTVIMNAGGQLMAYRLGSNPLLVQDGHPTLAGDLATGAHARMALGDLGLITYLWAER